MVEWRYYQPPALRGVGVFHVWVSRVGAIMERWTRSGVFLGGAYVLWEAETAEDQVDQLSAIAEGLMKRRERPGAGAPVPAHASYDDLLEEFPNLAAWFTDSSFDDGQPRQGGWVCVSCRGGMWAATMKDGAEGLTLHLSAPTATVLLRLMEDALADPKTPWRPDTAATQGKRNSRK